MCIPLCLLGVLFTAQPSVLFGATSSTTSITRTGILVGIMQAAFAASHKICIRYLKGEDANTQLMYLGGVSLVGSLIMAVIAQQWTLPSTFPQWMLLLLTACSAYGSQMSQTIALKMVHASLATAMSYLSVVWGILSGYFVFSEVPNALSLGGAFLVCSCTFVLGFAEHMSHANPEPHLQPQWWQRLFSIVSRMSSMVINMANSLWCKCTKKHDMYEQVTTDDFET